MFKGLPAPSILEPFLLSIPFSRPSVLSFPFFFTVRVLRRKRAPAPSRMLLCFAPLTAVLAPLLLSRSHPGPPPSLALLSLDF